MSELLTRFRYPLTYLLLVSVCAVSLTSGGGPAGAGLVSRSVLRLAAPLERVVTSPVMFVRGLWRDYVHLVGVRSENEELRLIVARLEGENMGYREAIVASERFQRLLDFRDRHDSPTVPANVVAQDLSSWFRSIVIDRGTDAGIETGMPVINERGVVGVVAGTAPGASKVLLVVDLQSRIDAYVQRSRARGSVRGRTGYDCDFDYVLRGADVRPGDVLLTSGLGAVYPKGLVLGTVSEVERRPFGLFQRARVRPAVDFRGLEEVFVILERREIPEDGFSGDGRLWRGETSGPP